ncbi:PspC domain-containing protein [Agromyces sp. NPDC058136]|uniref:PspC domain-containing protein n=1 Tax=Agromyces sp. NPDC058136 TaxID=3346354 RepID=UPI0036D8450B
METNQTAPEAGRAPEDVQGDSASAGPQAGGAVGSSPEDVQGDSASAGPQAGGAVGSASTPDATGPGFYPWLRRLGVPRRAGWLGGVCAGVAARLGIDPIIVRGIVVVIALLGAPFVLVYAIAWLLLPDTEGEIHLERLTQGVVDPAIVGIAVMGVVGFIPLVQGGWLGWRWWPDWRISDPVFGIDLTLPIRIVWALVVIGAIIWFIVWLAQRSSKDSPVGGAARMASAQAAGQGPTSGAAGAPGTAAAAAVASVPLAADPNLPAEPPVPAEGADAAEIAEWRHQHQQWRHSHAEWKAGQTEAIRTARAQAAEETRAQAREFQTQAAAVRAARKAARPRASAAAVFTALGLALVGGAAAAIWALADHELAGWAVPIALATATLVLAAGMFVAAVLRRRSGALATFTSLSLVAMLIAVASSSVAPFGTLLMPGSSIVLDASASYVQPVGDATVSLGYSPSGLQEVTLTQGTGNTYLYIQPGQRIQADLTDAGPVVISVISPDGTYSEVPSGSVRERFVVFGGDETIETGSDPTVDARLVLSQDSGSVFVQIFEGE